MKISKKNILFGFLILVVYGFAVNEWNIYSIKKSNPGNNISNNRCIVNNSTVFSIDNEWYVSQIKNYLNGKGFTVDPGRYNYNVRRTPVYPLFYGLHYVLFGEYKSYFFIRYTQILIYALAVIALFFAAVNFTNSKKIALACAILYGFHPSVVSFLYFTITESVSPSLVCFLMYFLSLCHKYNRKRDWCFAGFFFALGSLCRPTIFFLGFSILFVVIYKHRKDIKSLLLKSFSFGIGAALLFIPYMVRNYVVTEGEIIVLEKYYGDPMNYGMPNIEFRKWISCWTNAANYTSENISNEMQVAVCCDSSMPKEKVKESLIEKEMKNLPRRALLVNKKEDIRDAYISLYDYYNAKAAHYQPRVTDSFEAVCNSKMTRLREDYIRSAPLQYYIITPVLIVQSVIFQSNSAPLAFLDKYKNNLFKTALKSLLYLLNFFLFLSLLGSAFFIRKYCEIYFIVLFFVISSFIYITFHIRYFEARYLVPMFPCISVTGGIFLVEMTAYIRRRLNF